MMRKVSALAAALAFAAAASAQQPAPATSSAKNLKFQSTWPASLTLQDNFKMFAERVDKLTAGQVKIEAAAAGQYVPAFEILDVPNVIRSNLPFRVWVPPWRTVSQLTRDAARILYI